MFNNQLSQIQELAKSYYTALIYDQNKANALKLRIDALRLELALQAEVREIFYESVEVEAQPVADYRRDIYFSKNDIRYTVAQGIAFLDNGATVNLGTEGNRYRAITREEVAWQTLFSNIQGLGLPTGCQKAFKLPIELRFRENENLNFGVSGQTSGKGYIYIAGSTLSDEIFHESKLDALREEISGRLPQSELVPLVYQFPSAVAGTLAVDSGGRSEIFSQKSGKSVLLTHVATDSPNTTITSLSDEGRNQQIISDPNMSMVGFSADARNTIDNWYELPYPHLLRKGDRFKATILNGNDVNGGATETADINKYLVFKGQTL